MAQAETVVSKVIVPLDTHGRDVGALAWTPLSVQGPWDHLQLQQGVGAGVEGKRGGLYTLPSRTQRPRGQPLPSSLGDPGLRATLVSGRPAAPTPGGPGPEPSQSLPRLPTQSRTCTQGPTSRVPLDPPTCYLHPGPRPFSSQRRARPRPPCHRCAAHSASWRLPSAKVLLWPGEAGGMHGIRKQRAGGSQRHLERRRVAQERGGAGGRRLPCSPSRPPGSSLAGPSVHLGGPGSDLGQGGVRVSLLLLDGGPETASPRGFGGIGGQPLVPPEQEQGQQHGQGAQQPQRQAQAQDGSNRRAPGDLHGPGGGSL